VTATGKAAAGNPASSKPAAGNPASGKPAAGKPAAGTASVSKSSGKSGGKAAGKSSGGKADEGLTPRLVADNRKASFRFEILETIECGVMLRGTEVKSLRGGKVSLEEAYARIKDGALWLVDCDIPPYPQASVWNHEPKRLRKLLLHKREFLKFAGRAQQKGLTMVPLKLYFNERGIAKVLVGLCKGKKLHDKRESIKKREVDREVQRAMRRR
jgi:SsrA-binding protein